jgi:predicted nucleotidyltransferase
MKSPEPLLQEFKREVQTVYGPRFRQLILYGSYARGEAQQGSDVDVLLVLEGVSDPLAERERLSELICRLALEYDVVLSVIPVDEHALMTLRKPLFLNAKREGIAV